MKKKQTNKLPYIVPGCKVIQIEDKNFICVSVRTNTTGSSTQTNYDDKGTHDVGSVYFGDPSTIAPSKGGWFEEEEEEEEEE